MMSYCPMISIAFSDVSASVCATTFTSGLMSASRSRAESTFGRPMLAWPWMIWRCRFERSTVSKSTMPIVPDAGRGQVQRRRRAEPARADQHDLRVEQLALADPADLGQDDVAAVADRLLWCKS